MAVDLDVKGTALAVPDVPEQLAPAAIRTIDALAKDSPAGSVRVSRLVTVCGEAGFAPGDVDVVLEAASRTELIECRRVGRAEFVRLTPSSHA